MTSQYYINIEVTDRPGVLAAVAHVFANHADPVSEAVEDHVGKAIARRSMALAAD